VAGSEGSPPPVPDPTVLTTEALARAIAAERDYLNAQLEVLRERLRGIDRATELLNETVNRVPTDLQREIKHLRELTEERDRSVQTQFRERDTRQERESRDNKVAVEAAFSAQKESASEQNKSNTLAINKSEQATVETIAKLAELFKTSTDGLAGKLDDFKERLTRSEERLTRIESIKQGGKETLTGIYALVGFLVTLLVLGGMLAATGAFSH
jgi:chromosome segregation ATPase